MVEPKAEGAVVLATQLMGKNGPGSPKGGWC